VRPSHVACSSLEKSRLPRFFRTSASFLAV
jgi:hypothetical protein